MCGDACYVGALGLVGIRLGYRVGGHIAPYLVAYCSIRNRPGRIRVRVRRRVRVRVRVRKMSRELAPSILAGVRVVC